MDGCGGSLPSVSITLKEPVLHLLSFMVSQAKHVGMTQKRTEGFSQLGLPFWHHRVKRINFRVWNSCCSARMGKGNCFSHTAVSCGRAWDGANLSLRCKSKRCVCTPSPPCPHGFFMLHTRGCEGGVWVRVGSSMRGQWCGMQPWGCRGGGDTAPSKLRVKSWSSNTRFQKLGGVILNVDALLFA